MEYVYETASLISFSPHVPSRDVSGGSVEKRLQSIDLEMHCTNRGSRPRKNGSEGSMADPGEQADRSSAAQGQIEPLPVSPGQHVLPAEVTRLLTIEIS